MPKNKIYFTKDAENAIVEYNNELDSKKRSKIYSQRINKPLSKLVENIVNRFKFPYFQERAENLNNEVLSFLVMNMHKYDQAKGRAFSYFSILTKNYLILGNNEHYKMKKKQHRIDSGDSEHPFDIIDSIQEKKFDKDFPEYIGLLLQYWQNNLTCIFTKKPEMMIADAVLTLFERSSNIENFNKKSLYILIREMTGLRTQYITSVVNKMREHNNQLLREFNKNGYFNPMKVCDFKTTDSYF